MEGTTIWLMSKYNLLKYLALVSTLKVRFLQIVPPIAVQMANSKEAVRKFDLSCVKDIKCGAAPFPPGIEPELSKLFPQVPYFRQGTMLVYSFSDKFLTYLLD